MRKIKSIACLLLVLSLVLGQNPLVSRADAYLVTSVNYTVDHTPESEAISSGGTVIVAGETTVTVFLGNLSLETDAAAKVLSSAEYGDYVTAAVALSSFTAAFSDASVTAKVPGATIATGDHLVVLNAGASALESYLIQPDAPYLPVTSAAYTVAVASAPYTVSGSGTEIYNGMPVVTDVLGNLTIEAGSSARIFSKAAYQSLVDASASIATISASAAKKADTDVVVHEDVLYASKDDNSKAAVYIIQTTEATERINNGKLRAGDGTESSIGPRGGLLQPFYFNSGSWYQLTYSNYPLNYAIGIDGTNNDAWNTTGTKSVDEDLGNLACNYAALLHGSGTATATGELTIDGKLLGVTNQYELGANASFIKITTSVRNKTAGSIANVRYWTGTQDDYVGGTDSPTKTKGNLAEGVFVPTAADSDQAKALLISAGAHSVLFFSTHATTEMILNPTLSFSGQLTMNPRTTSRTMTGDDSYGMYVNLGDIAADQTKSFVWYYAAGSAADIGSITEDVGGDAGASASTDATLSALVPSAGTLAPAFDAATTTYTMTVPYATASLTVTPTCTDDGATLTVNGSAVSSGAISQSIPLTVGVNAVNVVVTAEDGTTTKTYTVTVTRSSAPATSPATPTPSPTPPPVAVIVNGEVQNAGTALTETNNGVTTTTVTVDQAQIETRLAVGGAGSVIVIPVPQGAEVSVGKLTGDLIDKMEQLAATLEIRTEAASYRIPSEQIDIAGIAGQFGAGNNLEGIQIRVEIAEPAAADVRVVASSIAAESLTLVVPAVEFRITASYAGRDVPVEFFNKYVERTIAIPDGVDPSRITTGIVIDPDGTVRHVPTRVTLLNGRYYAVINSLTNSMYSVVWNPKRYADVEGNWARTEADDMGSRLVIEGISDSTFLPDGTISRAEFAKALVRALGLKPGIHADPFSDVTVDNPFVSFITTMRHYGLASGYDNGRFGWDKAMTRAEAAVMLQNAMKLTTLYRWVGPYETQALLGSFQDAGLVPEWSKSATANCVRVGIVEGRQTGMLYPLSTLTRAEAAAMIRRLLIQAGLI